MSVVPHPDLIKLWEVADETEQAVMAGDLDSPDTAISAVDRIVGSLADTESVRTMARDRTDPVIKLHPELILLAPQTILRSVWMDAFTLGVLFQRHGGKAD